MKKVRTIEGIKSEILRIVVKTLFEKINDNRRCLSTDSYDKLRRNGLSTVRGHKTVQEKISILQEMLPAFRISAKNSGVNADCDLDLLETIFEELITCKNIDAITQKYADYFSIP